MISGACCTNPRESGELSERPQRQASRRRKSARQYETVLVHRRSGAGEEEKEEVDIRAVVKEVLEERLATGADERVFKWKEDISALLGESGEEVSAEGLEDELKAAVTTGIDEPSLYVLVSAKGTLDPKPSEHTWCCGLFIRPGFTTLCVTAIAVLLTFLTIVLPLCMLANFYHNTPIFHFKYEVDEPEKSRVRAHRAYLSFTAAFLLFYLLYTSLAVLDEIRVMRFFLLGVPAASEKEVDLESAWETVGNDTRRRRLSSKALKFGKDVIQLGQSALIDQSPLERRFLIIGITSKCFSLIAVFQLTFFVFRKEPTGVGMILNSVALQFILDADRILVAALKNTPLLARWYGRAVNKLRTEAEQIAVQPNVLTTMVLPSTYTATEVIRQSLSNRAADYVASKFPRTTAWLLKPDKRGEDLQDPLDPPYLDGITRADARYDLTILHRRCCRSEWLHRTFSKVVYVYGTMLIVLQVVGTTVCNATSICQVMNKLQGFDDELYAD